MQNCHASIKNEVIDFFHCGRNQMVVAIEGHVPKLLLMLHMPMRLIIWKGIQRL